MSGLRGDSLTSPCLTHRSLTCCLTDFMHKMNDAQRKTGPTPLILIPPKCPTSSASISFLNLSIRFKVWVVWLNNRRLHLPKMQIKLWKNRKGEGGARGSCSMGPPLLSLKTSGDRKNTHWLCQVTMVFGTSVSLNGGSGPWGSRRRGKVHTFSISFARFSQIQSVADTQNQVCRAPSNEV